MTDTPRNLIRLAKTLADHENVTHSAISMRIFGKGNYFSRLQDGTDPRNSTCVRAFDWFSSNWPEDLEWPSDIPRPAPETRKAS